MGGYYYNQRHISHPRLFYVPTGLVSEPPFAVTMLDVAVRMVLHMASVTWNHIATSIWRLSPRRASEQADGTSSSFTASHRERWLLNCASETISKI